MKTLVKSLVIAASFVSAAAFAQDPAPAAPTQAPATPVEAPSADAAKSVWNFFYNGKGSGQVVLGEAKLCTSLVKEGEHKNECDQEVSGPVKAGTSVMVHQSYLIPKDDSVEDIQVQVKQGNTVRETKDVSKMKGEGVRTRTWTTVKLPKAGDWTISIMRGDKTLKDFTVKVQ